MQTNETEIGDTAASNYTVYAKRNTYRLMCMFKPVFHCSLKKGFFSFDRSFKISAALDLKFVGKQCSNSSCLLTLK